MLNTPAKKRKRLKENSRRLLVLAVAACGLIVAFPPPAYAYVDPSVMTYTIQALAGVAVALGAVAGVAFRRTRKVLMRFFKIDENARKEIEGDVHSLDASGAPIFADGEKASRADGGSKAPYTKKRVTDDEPLPWPKRFVVSMIAAIFVVLTLFVVGPYEIVSSSSKSLVFGLPDVWLPVAISAAIFALCLAVVLSLFRGKGFSVVVAFVVAVGVCSYIQVMFFNTSLPSADGTVVVWSDYTTITVISAACWVAIILAFIGFALFRKRQSRALSMSVSVVLILVQTVAVASLFLAPQTAGADTAGADDPLVVTEDGLFEVSSQNNVVVFILDKFDTSEMEHLLDERPDLLEGFKGFTYYPDSIGSMVPTMFALPYLVTGELPQEGEDFSTYIEERYARSTFLEDIAKQGFSVGIYSDSLGWGDVSELADSTVNIHPLREGRSAVDPEGTVRILYQCALYRGLPWLLKPPFWFYTDDVNQAMVKQSPVADGADTPYTMDDLRYNEKLSSSSLQVEDGAFNGSFRLIHLNGSHEPYVMDESGLPAPGGESTRDAQSIGALGIVEKYINQLKLNGLYETATIVVMADHGDWYVSEDPITEPTSPLMLVKPAGDAAAAEKPCETSSIPVSHRDFFATVIDAVGGDSSKYGTSIPEIDDPNRKRYYYMTTTSYSEGYVNEIIEFEIDGPMSDFGNWRLTGQKWYYDSSNYR